MKKLHLQPGRQQYSSASILFVGGDWAMAKFIEVTETENEAERNALMSEILTYNEEDLSQ